MAKTIEHWNPEDEDFWRRTGRRIAWKNLVWSILAEHIGFSVWSLWSVVALELRAAGRYTEAQCWWLTAIPGLVGALMRFPYTFAVPKFGGRNWTVVSVLLLLIPAALLAFFVDKPDTPFWLMAVVAGTAGLGGGNFASSMANISFFFPDRDKGLALGINAAGGNVGVSTVQLYVPALLATGLVSGVFGATPGPTGKYLQEAGVFWVPLILVSAIGAYVFMNNLSSAKSSFKDQMAVSRSPHTWTMSWLYIGTFGSFIGYSFAFPQLMKREFPEIAVGIAFLGPLTGSLARPLGGWLADRLGGTKVTFVNFVVMAASTLGVIFALQAKSFPGFLGAFLAVFVTTGIGNGSTYRMIPVIFRTAHLRDATDAEARMVAAKKARRDSAAAIGITSAVGALGGFFVPKSFGASIEATGGPTLALGCFLGFYVSCMALTWWCYMRTRFLVRVAPSLAAEAEA